MKEMRIKSAAKDEFKSIVSAGVLRKDHFAANLSWLYEILKKSEIKTMESHWDVPMVTDLFQCLKRD